MTTYRALWGPASNRAHFVQLEPPQAIDRVLVLLKYGHPFVVEIDPAKIKDMVILNHGAKWEERDTADYISKRATTYDDAAQYAVNLIAAELSFAVEPQQMPDPAQREWRFTVEMRKR